MPLVALRVVLQEMAVGLRSPNPSATHRPLSNILAAGKSFVQSYQFSGMDDPSLNRALSEYVRDRWKEQLAPFMTFETESQAVFLSYKFHYVYCSFFTSPYV